jgi:pimeloyl-ACP methyl ester carboxylesterase
MVGGSIPSSPRATFVAWSPQADWARVDGGDDTGWNRAYGGYDECAARVSLGGLEVPHLNKSDVAPDYVLVHGAYGDETAWAKIVPMLVAAGAKVRTLTLAAHSDADNALAGQTTLADYIEQVREIVAAAEQPVVLAGHSMAGMVITGVAEAMPEKIAALAYVCAVLPEQGRSLMSYAASDAHSRFAAHAVPDQERGVITISREGLIDAVFGRASESDAAAATATIREEPLQPFVAEARVTNDRFGRVPRFYVTTTHDRALTPSLQRTMYEAQPCEYVYTVDSDHAPMLSAPQELADALLDVRARLMQPV